MSMTIRLADLWATACDCARTHNWGRGRDDGHDRDYDRATGVRRVMMHRD